MTAKYVPFSDLLANIVDNRGKTCPTSETGIPLIATNCIRNDLLYPAYDRVRYVSQETFRTWFRGHPKPGDFIFVTKGTPGRVCLAPDPVDFCIAQDMVAIRANEAQVDSKYLFALLRSGRIQQQIEQLHVGTLIPHFKKGDFDKLLLPIPDRSLQSAIGTIYFDLSRKIEVNHRMNETLQAISRGIFKSWFVDFDPVRAKAAGQQCSEEVAAVFPDSFQNSSLGSIPKDWQVGRLDDLLLLQRGFDLPSTERTPGPYPVLTASGPSGTHSESRVKGPGVTTGRSGLLGKIFFVHEDFWPLNTSLWVKEFRGAMPIHAFHILQNLDFSSFNAGSAVPTLNRNHVHGLPVVVPPLRTVQKFEEIVQPMFRMIRQNDREAETVASIRDALLPKLLSGYIRLKDAEKIVEALA